MDVTIVIPVLNEAHRIEKILQSLVGYDVIVVDGGSEDSTIRIARQYDVTILTWTQGRASQMNAGAARAEGDPVSYTHLTLPTILLV